MSVLNLNHFFDSECWNVISEKVLKFKIIAPLVCSEKNAFSEVNEVVEIILHIEIWVLIVWRLFLSPQYLLEKRKSFSEKLPFPFLTSKHDFFEKKMSWRYKYFSILNFEIQFCKLWWSLFKFEKLSPSTLKQNLGFWDQQGSRTAAL